MGEGKTHVAETICKALKAEYGENVVIDISLTDIEGDKRSLNELSAPAKDVSFKIVEEHKKR